MLRRLRQMRNMETNDEIVKNITPELFLDVDGDRLHFAVRGSEKYFKSTIEKIQKGGGLVILRRNGPNTIILDLPTSLIFGEEEVFSVDYISDCCKESVLVDLKKYRLNKHSKYKKGFDVNLILLKKLSWSDVPLESPQNSSDFFDEIEHRRSNPFKTGSRPYNNTERMAIINYIISKKAYSVVAGNAFWMKMERDKVCKGRTWQSLKEHFKKKIFPQIGSYGLNETTVKNFKERRRLIT